MKKRIDVIASEESFNNLSTFDDIEEMNKTVRVYRDVIKSTVKRTDVQARLIALLELLKRHSCKQIGVSYMCKNTIAEKLEVSYKTVQRLVKKLVDLGMIKQVSMKRKKDMLQTANAIIIIPAKSDMSDKTPSKESSKCPTIKTTSVSLKQNINKRYNGDETEFTSNRVPKKFISLASCFYDKASVIEELWKVITCATKRLTYSLDEVTEMACDTFRQLVRQIKKNRVRKSVYACYWGIVNNRLDEMYFEECYELGVENTVNDGWLN